MLVAETGRGELLAALGKLGVEADAVATDPRPELAARADAELGGLGLHRVLERIGPPGAASLAALAARKLRPGGRLALEAAAPDSRRDPALARPVDPDFLVFSLREAGFREVDLAGGDHAYQLFATR